ncbi:MAG: hypothetical protein R3F59_35055 [Myxococcota bacterium]
MFRTGVWLALGVAGCGECVFDEDVTGVVTVDGAVMAGVQVKACQGEGCEAGDERVCAATTTAEDGSFALTVPMCRPAPM